jgi:phospholipid-translocating ATPase
VPNSWTIITWVIIPGSSLVMLLWIVLYSFFESFDFGHEVQRLFGGITFWVTVVLAVAIALREFTKLSSFAYSSLDFLVPRVLVKFVSTSFAPQDIDIIRYMWVKGNLKDRLGIRARRGQNAPVDGSSSGLEGTSMFSDTHAHSHSEVSIYEPGRLGGSGDSTPTTQAENLTGTSLQFSATVVASSSSSHRILAPIAATSEDDDMPIAISATEAGVSVAMPHSPQPSYYSASDIPLPSPLPSPSIHNPSQAYPRMASISYSRPIRGQYLSPLLDHVPSPPNSTEMRAHDRKLNESFSSPGLSAHSEASYELSAMGKPGDQRRSRSSSPAWRASTLLTTDEPTAL